MSLSVLCEYLTRPLRRILIGSVVVASTLLTAEQGFAQAPFINKPTLTTGNSPKAIAVGDFKNNQLLGVAVTSGLDPNESVVKVFYGNGDGTFPQSNAYPTGANPVAIAMGDFKNRGATDIAVVNQDSDSITILLNTGTGNGQFTAGTTLNVAASSGLSAIAVGDFDGDHNLDLAVTSFNNNNVLVFLGNGNGTFQAPLAFPTGAAPNKIVVADFNHDNFQDIAVTNSGSFTVTVLLGDGSGQAFAATNYDAYSPHGFPHASGLALGDFNRDGYQDLAVSFNGVSFATVLINNGNGTFKAPVAYATAAQSYGIAAADIDHNGNLALLAPYDGVVHLLHGNGDGTFRPQISIPVLGGSSTGIAIGAFTGTKRVDAAVTINPNLALILSDDIIFADGF